MLDKAKIYIIDFEDSFTFNIATELYLYEKDILVVSHHDFFLDKNFTTLLANCKTPTAVILGPGPGSPAEYQVYFEQIKMMKMHLSLFLMGICLGHQILALIDGLSIRPSKKPLHGSQVRINFEDKNILVQRYNSLAVYENIMAQKEIQVRQWARGISYQFHPESIGTENRHLFFKELVDFIHAS
jgi:anthranilate/para-aminobenzoate synthase component II